MTRGGRSTAAARCWWGLTTAVVVIGLVGQLVLQVQGVNILVDEATGELPGLGTRLVRFASYFTIQSNVLVAVTTAALAVDPHRDGRLWRVLRLDALLGITLTGLVFVTLLRGLLHLGGAAAVTNALLHYWSPALVVVGWVAFGPRPRVGPGVWRAAMLWPALYVVHVVAHGAVSHWYPYPFIDVDALGYPRAALNGLGLALSMAAVGGAFAALDRRLPRAPR